MFSLSTQNPKCDHQQREQKVTENTGPLHLECIPAGVKASSLLEKQLWACSADKSSVGTARLAGALSPSQPGQHDTPGRDTYPQPAGQSHELVF